MLGLILFIIVLFFIVNKLMDSLVNDLAEYGNSLPPSNLTAAQGAWFITRDGEIADEEDRRRYRQQQEQMQQMQFQQQQLFDQQVQQDQMLFEQQMMFDQQQMCGGNDPFWP